MQQSTPTELMVSMEIAVRYLCVEIHDYFFFFFFSYFNGVIKMPRLILLTKSLV